MMQLETSNQHPENIINNLQKIGLYNEQFSQTTPLYIYILVVLSDYKNTIILRKELIKIYKLYPKKKPRIYLLNRSQSLKCSICLT